MGALKIQVLKNQGSHFFVVRKRTSCCVVYNSTTSLPPFTTKYQENPNIPIKQGKEQCKTIKKGVAIIPEIV
jgi:hypothetical protein